MTLKPVRLLHLSDIHFGAEDPNALAAVFRVVRETKPDVLIVAGDITQSGKRREFEAARAWFDALGLPAVIAPGNHDTPALHLPVRLVTPFGRYERYMRGIDAVGRLAELNDGHVRISAINTARGMQGRINWANGVIDLHDLEVALAQLCSGPADAWRILVCHHPMREPGLSRISVDTRRGGEALRRCAAAHVDAILTGHVHDAFAHTLHTPRRHMVQMGSGTLSTRLRATRPSFCMVTMEAGRLTQDVITVDGGTLEWSRRYNSHLH